MFAFDATNLPLIENMDTPSFDPSPLIQHIFSIDPPQLFLPQVTKSVLSGNPEAVYESLLGGLQAIAGDASLSATDKEHLTKNFDLLQNEGVQRTDGKKWILLPESIATKTLCMHPQFGVELQVSHQAKLALANFNPDHISLPPELIEANKKAFRTAFIDNAPAWDALIKPFLQKIRDYLQQNKAHPSYMDFIIHPEFAKAVALYSETLQTLIQKPFLKLDSSGRSLSLS